MEKEKKTQHEIKTLKTSVRNQPKAIAECTVVLRTLWKRYLFDAKLLFCHFQKNTLHVKFLAKKDVCCKQHSPNQLTSSNVAIQDLTCKDNFQTFHYPTPQYCKSPHSYLCKY